MAVSLRSEPKIWIGARGRRPMTSSSEIAIEYTSSPVEHPATQIRIGAPSGLCFRIAGRICDSRRVEDLRIPEERRDVNEDVLVERADLLRIALQQSQVVLQILRAAQRHPAGQPPLEGRRACTR